MQKGGISGFTEAREDPRTEKRARKQMVPDKGWNGMRAHRVDSPSDVNNIFSTKIKSGF